jgi:3-oxoadipate enol-lactonase
MPTADLGDVTLQYEVSGDGPPLLVVSGTASDLRRAPSIFSSALVRHFTVMAYDHRGLGRSTAADPDYQPTMADFANDALRLCRHVGWDRFYLVGISFGGMVAQEIALAGGDRVRRLVLVGTSPGGPGRASAPLHEVYALPAPERAERLARYRDRRTASDPVRLTRLTRFLLRLTQNDDPAVKPGLRKQLEARRHHDAWDRLPSLRVPTLVAAGLHDGLAPLGNAEALTSRIPGAELRVFEGGHIFLLEDPAAWPSIISFLLKRESQRPRSWSAPHLEQTLNVEAPPIHPEALFQVGDQQPVSFGHLERVNPGETVEAWASIRSLRPGESVTLAREGATVRVRRTR